MICGKDKIKKDDWETPNWLFNQLNARFNFTLDSACTKKNCKVKNKNRLIQKSIFKKKGLTISWNNERVFCNPPFTQKNIWIKKAYDEVMSGKCPLVIMILPNCIDIVSFNKYIDKIFYWQHLPYRVAFIDEKGKSVKGNPSGTIIVYFWKNIIRSNI